MNEIKGWFYIDDDGNVAPFDREPVVCLGEAHLIKGYLNEYPYTLLEEAEAASTSLRGYSAIPFHHEIAKYVVKHIITVRPLESTAKRDRDE